MVTEDIILGERSDGERSDGEMQELPGGPVLRTLYFHFRGTQVQSLVGELRYCMPCLHAMQPKKKIRMVITRGWKGIEL